VTKVVLQQRHKIKGSVTKVTGSLVFLADTIPFCIHSNTIESFQL